jgi:pyruvate dehydrogenase E1 component
MADIDPQETQDWLDSLAAVLERDGAERARFLLDQLLASAANVGAAPSGAASGGLSTPYRNTLPSNQDPPYPGDLATEEHILRLLRWNAIAMVVKANKENEGLGGHLATYASAAHLYEVGLHHVWRGSDPEAGAQNRGDLVYIQGHGSPGIYARAFLEGRLSEEQIRLFRRDTLENGISSYPHPWLMGDFWQFATVSMGLGPLMAIYQARFAKYLHNRGLTDLGNRKVWAFLGDGETDEPESLGALSIAAREGLDNLVFVVNCNLQRLDGPVRGNGKIIQELEGIFRGARWNVLKVLWNSAWDRLFAADHDGQLGQRLEELVDGEYQNWNARGIDYLKEHIFGEALADRIAGWSDEELAELGYGGHDPKKIHAAYRAAVEHTGGPTVILAKTIKGYGLGEAGQGANTSHQLKKMSEDDLEAFRQRFDLPLKPDPVRKLHFYRPAEDSDEIRYLKERRRALGGSLPARRTDAPALPVPDLDAFQTITKGSGERENSTTMAFVNALRVLTRQKGLKEHLVPIVADEARTFGMEGLFRQLGIYAPMGQKYQPVDADTIMPYTEKVDGQILQEGITEAGATASWVAAGTAYANHGVPMVPFFIFYSMFGFQRVADLIWAGGDMQARGFLIGATSGRTTLNGEGLQHEDGHSHLIAATVPNCRAYDPTYAYEVAVILQDGLRRMAGEQENIFYYLTTLNEDYAHPEMPAGVEEGILRGLYPLRQVGDRSRKKRVRLLGCGSILRQVEAAADLLDQEFGVSSEVWSAPSFNELRRDGLTVERWNRLHPGETPRVPYVTQCLEGDAPVVAATDYMKAFADQVRAWVPAPYTTLGTDGFGRSDTREDLRNFFEVDARWIAAGALKALADQGVIKTDEVKKAFKKLDIDADKPEPVTQ